MFLPGGSGYEPEADAYNTACIHRPAVVVGAMNTQDIADAVTYASGRDLAVAVQCTGHGAFVPANDAVLLSTRRMTRMTIDPVARTARIQAGVRWKQVIEAAAPYGLAPLNGSSPSVGAVGFTLGGGLGPLGRRYGFAADNVRTLEMVTADGRVRVVDQDREPDLFWAARGGKGNFGIVSSMQVDLFPVPRIHGGGVYFDGVDAPAVLHAFREWVWTLPEDFAASVALIKLPDLPRVPTPVRGKFVAHLRVVYLGEAAEGDRLLAPMRKAAPVVLDTVRDMPYSEVGSVYNDPPDPFPFWERATLLRALPEEAVESLVSLGGADSGSPFNLIDIRRMGGALGRSPEPANAVGGRDGEFSVTIFGSLLTHRERDMNERVTRLFEALSPYSTGAGLLNFQGNAHTPDDVARVWPAATYRRLQEIKRAYDPRNVFRGAYPIPPGPSASTDRRPS
ncbi:FAD-binding oxidoreductase [Sinosporangium album]|uniref:FAD-binding oxidoreductase n=1 Tax=Sinosporangium album TaxID=504805 RepID=UPI001C40AB72|nr:FAD-binding oxidoreductase [Sinosporangium album]